MTNLRLLDLDRSHDWPGITVQTFSAKNADQKQRIGATEWALFRLFELWDSDDTAQKLQPFFPPLEPLQSLNLRAALYRCLNELKKNGALGRETILRKTMLDECKGDKFYEIIAFFSTMVLKKVLSAQKDHNQHAAVAMQLATASSLSADTQRSLLPLAIAHKAALVNVLRRKEEQRIKFDGFVALLDSKAVDINKQLRKCIETPRSKKPKVSQKQAQEVMKELKDHWIGNPKWLDVMLHGDDVRVENMFLTSRFDKIWQMVEKGQKLEQVTTNEIGLLENLQSRVQEQELRLQRWKAFHRELTEELTDDQYKSTKLCAGAPAVVKDFKFDEHTRLQLPLTRQNDEAKAVRRPLLSQPYQEILSSLDAELLNLSSPASVRPLSDVSRKHASSSLTTESHTRNRKDPAPKSKPTNKVDSFPKSKQPPHPQNSSFMNAPVLHAPRRTAVDVTPADSEATDIGYASTVPSALPSFPLAESSFQTQNDMNYVSVPTPPSSDLQANQICPSPPVHDSSTPGQSAASPAPSTNCSSEPPVPALEISDLNPEEALADQIIDSIGNATPSPVKKPQPRMSLSLIERTRMTMSRTTSFEPLPESPSLPSLPMPPPPPLPSSELDRQATLLERTRQSMISMQSAPRRQSLVPRQEKRQSRSSLFPVNQFDTPRTRKSIGKIEEARSLERTPTEVLLSDKVDYDRVFKSRPRIATSPIFSPTEVDGYGGRGEGEGEREGGSEGEFEDGVTGIDLGDVDRDEDYEEASWAESPSRRKGGGH